MWSLKQLTLICWIAYGDFSTKIDGISSQESSSDTDLLRILHETGECAPCNCSESNAFADERHIQCNYSNCDIC
jgi:hypothetical protein